MTIYKLKQNIIYKKEKWDILGLSSDFKMISNKHEKILDCIVKILLFNKNLLPLFDKYNNGCSTWDLFIVKLGCITKISVLIECVWKSEAGSPFFTYQLWNLSIAYIK